jgi:hypothetical protein
MVEVVELEQTKGELPIFEAKEGVPPPEEWDNMHYVHLPDGRVILGPVGGIKDWMLIDPLDEDKAVRQPVLNAGLILKRGGIGYLTGGPASKFRRGDGREVWTTLAGEPETKQEWDRNTVRKLEEFYPGRFQVL